MDIEIKRLVETPILSHQFSGGAMLYLVEDEGEKKWVPESEFDPELIKNYWHNVEVVDLQDQRQVFPGKLVGVLPNSIKQKFSIVIQREIPEDPLMIVPPREAMKIYMEQYLDEVEKIYRSSTPCS